MCQSWETLAIIGNYEIIHVSRAVVHRCIAVHVMCCYGGALPTIEVCNSAQ
jgi:hypothetical protein